MDGKKLAELRERAGMSQWGLSVATKVNPATISEIERGVRSGKNPRIATVKALADVLAERLGRKPAGVLAELMADSEPSEPAPAAKAVGE